MSAATTTTPTATPIATSTLPGLSDLLMATDDRARGCAWIDADGLGARALTEEVGTAVDRALWAFLLQAELEEALDAALLRAALAGTPTLSGPALSGPLLASAR